MEWEVASEEWLVKRTRESPTFGVVQRHVRVEVAAPAKDDNVVGVAFGLKWRTASEGGPYRNADD
jgi:hypothetical protein